MYSFQSQSSKKEVYNCNDTKAMKERAHRSSSKHKKQGRHSLYNEKKAEPTYEGLQRTVGESLASGLYPDSFIPSHEEPFLFRGSSGKSKPFSGQIIQEDLQVEEVNLAAADLCISGEQDQPIVSNLFPKGSCEKNFLFADTETSILDTRGWKASTFNKEECNRSIKFGGIVNSCQHARKDEGYYNNDFSLRNHLPSLTSDSSERENMPATMTAKMSFEDKYVATDISVSSASYIPSHMAQSMPASSSGVSATNSYVESMNRMQESEIGMPPSPTVVKSITSEQICERWRLKGNQAYASGNFSKAEEYYSRGASSISPNETSQSCIRASMLCYSNRTLTRMALGRMREALSDCMQAMEVDSMSFRLRLRAASCHLALGETEAAATLFKECLKLSKDCDKPDKRIVVEAAEGLNKVQHLLNYTTKILELLRNGGTSNATAALQLLNDSLIISPYSEHLLQLKGEILLSLQKYEEVIELCEQSLASSERNHPAMVNDISFENSSTERYTRGTETTSVMLWRWEITAKALFYLGKPEDSLALVTKYEEDSSKITHNMSAHTKSGKGESMETFGARIRELLHHKVEGDAALEVEKNAEAVEHYTKALACSKESYPFTAVCFCSRAAASQAVGDILDAIADCSWAIAFDLNYSKPISLRATLYETVRDYGQARHDLMRLIALLESFQHRNVKSHSGRSNSDAGDLLDLNQACKRLAKVEEEMKKGYALDHYAILGVEPSCSASEIRKAYRKAALRHHPDKASQVLMQGEAGDEESLWKEIGHGIRNDAEHLFKMIGRSYAILSDPAKRLRYDTDEELRKKRETSDARKAGTEPYFSQYGKGSKVQHDETWNL